uniref:Uncharacterized protein LOC100186090 n=1 Tax=Phallusia mammillata TaxID=59560 RepID=A0A6F9DIX9_9ASCI|nr:uncharacterized protein LOC100186090 [Phallusia mammillata]
MMKKTYRLPWLPCCAVVIIIFACAKISTAFNPLSPTTVAKPDEIPHYNCSKKCAFQVVSQPRPQASAYFKCMNECVQAEWILFQNGSCVAEFMVSSAGESITCAPSDVKVHEFDFELKPGGPHSGYLLVIWQPCTVGKDAVEGYQLNVRPFGRVHADCMNLKLSRTLDRYEQITFTALYPRKLIQDQIHSGYLISTPHGTSLNEADFFYRAKSCSDLNINECNCPNDVVRQYEHPNVTVKGYTVNITASLVPECKYVEYYHLFVGFKLLNQLSGTWIHYKNFFTRNLAPGEIPTYTFHPIYPVLEGGNTTAGVLASTSHLRRVARSYFIHIAAWVPPLPRVEELDTGAIEVSFQISPPEYNVTHFAVRLNKHPQNNAEFQVLQSQNATSDMVKNGNITLQFYNVGTGLRSVQIQEMRVGHPKGHQRFLYKVFQDPEWGPGAQIRILTPWERFKAHHLAPVVSSVVVIVLIVIIVVLFLYFWKEGYCPHVRYYVPVGLAKWLDSQTTSEVVMRSRTVLLVWQADTRSNELAEKHACVIRHLASFLRSVCGLDVILDMFEQTQMSTAMSKWVHEAFERAEFVIFISPHFDCDEEPEDGSFQPLLGDFNYMFKYIEPKLRNRRKFITALLPYSDVNSCDASRVLKNCTLTFKLMDHIDDLYLHIQEKSKVSFMGRHSVMYVSHKDYTETSQGRALSDSIVEMMKMASSPKKTSLSPKKRISCSSASLSLDGGSGSSQAKSLSSSEDNVMRSSRDSDFVSDLATNHLGVIPPEPVKCLCRKVTDRIHPPPPLVENPEEHIRLINATSSPVKETQLPGVQDMCPYHKRRITEEPSYTNFPDDGYGEQTTTDVSTQEDPNADSADQFTDEAIMRFLRARSLVPQQEYVQLNVQTLPTMNESPSQNHDTFEGSSYAKSLGGMESPENEERQRCGTVYFGLKFPSDEKIHFMEQRESKYHQGMLIYVRLWTFIKMVGIWRKKRSRSVKYGSEFRVLLLCNIVDLPPAPYTQNFVFSSMKIYSYRVPILHRNNAYRDKLSSF